MPPFSTLPKPVQGGGSALQAASDSFVTSSSHFKPLPVDPLLNFSILTCQLLKSGYVLTLEDPHRFAQSRSVGGFLGLRPGKDKSGQQDPELRITKTGNPQLRRLLVQSAQQILGPFGADCELRQWGLKLASRGRKNAKKRAVVAVARKLAVLLHRLWVNGEVYEPFYQARQQRVKAAVSA